jgi:UDP:flavonoid glycosyltransferase YjiC (YdhE family)
VNRVRLLFTTPAGIGHLHPLLPLAGACRERGDEVRFASDAANCAAAERVGFTATPAGISGARRRDLVGPMFGVDVDAVVPRDRGDVLVPYAFGGVAAPEMAPALRELVAEWAPDIVVHDPLEFAAPLVAAELGVHHVTHSFGSTVPAHRLHAAEAFVSPLWERSGLTAPAMCGVFADVYVDIRPSSLPGHPPAGTRALTERPTPADAIGGELPAIVTEGDDRPLVYLTLGTVWADADLLRSAVQALAALDVRVLVTVGPRGDPDALGHVRDGVQVLRYVPQPQLLPHCAVVVSHAGSGTFFGTLANGVPQLCLPQGADQFLNADAAAAIGAALTLEGEAATGAAITDAAAELLRSTAYRTVAQEIADEIARMPDADQVAGSLPGIASG